MKNWRKWSIAAAALVMSFILALLGKLTGEFATVVTVTSGAFMAGNAVEYMRNGK